jgi:hypothetical protein
VENWADPVLSQQPQQVVVGEYQEAWKIDPLSQMELGIVYSEGRFWTREG